MGESMGNFFYCAKVYIRQNLHFEQFKMLSRIKSAHCCASITIIHLQNFSFSQTETLYPSQKSPLPLLPGSLYFTFCLCTVGYSMQLMEVEFYTVFAHLCQAWLY